MITKFDVGDTIYIPIKVVSININKAGVLYKSNLKDTITILSGHVVDVPEDVPLKIPDDLYIAIQKRLHPKEFVEPKG